MPPNISIVSAEIDFEDYDFRTPLKFGGAVVDKVTLLNVTARVKDRMGREMEGFGSMPLSSVWAFPSKIHPYEETLSAMKRLADVISRITRDLTDYGHPITLNHALEPQYLEAAKKVTEELKLQEPIPDLCTLVTASPFDAAIHDAYGKMLGMNGFSLLSDEYMNQDLSHYLNEEFQGEYLDRYVSKTPKETLPLYHLVGALDPITEEDIAERIGDGLPETLPEWINQDGLTHIKIKLNGDNLDWDVERVVRIDRVTEQTQTERGVSEWYYSLDFNERCPNVEYLLEFLSRIREQAPLALDRVQYIEQPTARDLTRNPDNKMHKAAEIKPVVIDESLLSFESLLLARELGYTGVALKACKGQSQSLLAAAAAQKYNMFLCVQDLTCPGASFLHSASLAAHIPPVAAIEGNSRQYVPAANETWKLKFPHVFKVKQGTINTSSLNGPGLGVVPPPR